MTGNETHYRETGRAVFLAAMMVLSVVAMSTALVGTTAAQGNDVEYDPDRPWQGQDVIASNLEPNEDYDLRRVTDSNDDVTGSEFVEEYVADGTGNVTVDTSDLDPGDYFLRGDGLDHNPSMDDTFEIRVQTLDVAFEDDEVGDAGTQAQTDLEIDSNRGTYTLNVSADGDLDAEQLFGIFADADDYENATDNRTTMAELEATGTPSEQRSDYEVGTDVFGDFRVALYEDHEDDADETIVMVGIRDLESTVSFDGIDTGEYTFEFEAVDTDAEASADVSVFDVDDVEAELLTRSVEATVGDAVAITVSVTGDQDTFSIAIGDDEDDGYEYHAVIEKDDQDVEDVTVVFNTYWAGLEDKDLLRAPTDDDEGNVGDILVQAQATPAGEIEGLLDAGDYDVSVVGGDARDWADGDVGTVSGDVDDGQVSFSSAVIDEADDVTGLFLDRAEMDEAVTTWTAPGANAGDYETVADVTAGIDDGEITQTDRLARGDLFVHQIQVDGLSGLVTLSESTAHDGDPDTQSLRGLSAVDDEDDQDVSETFANLITSNATNFAVEQTDPTQNRQPLELNVSASLDADAFTVVADVENDEYWIVLDSADAVFDRGDASDVDLPDRTVQFDAEFEITDAALLDVDAEDADEPVRLVEADDGDDVVTAVGSYDVPEREGEFDAEEPLELTPAVDQEVTGTTTLAPGTELRLRLRSTDDTQPRFTLPRDVDVNTDRTWAETFDFSDQSVDNTFEARLRGPSAGPFDDGAVEIDGVFVEAAAPDAPTPTPEPDAPTPEPDAATPEPDAPTPEPDTATPTPEPEQYGFGVVVAVLALTSAALLAIRRRR